MHVASDLESAFLGNATTNPDSVYWSSKQGLETIRQQVDGYKWIEQLEILSSLKSQIESLTQFVTQHLGNIPLLSQYAGAVARIPSYMDFVEHANSYIDEEEWVLFD